MRPTLLLLLAIPAAAAAAAPAVSLSSTVLTEQTRIVAGRQQTSLVPAATVVPGSQLVFRTSFRNAGSVPAQRVVVTNPLPRGVVFRDVSGPGAEVSIDGGRSFGPLARLTVRGLDGQSRAAQASDVSVVRWTVPVVPSGAAGNLEYRGTVR